MDDHHAAATEPTDEEWAAALGDTPRTHRLTPTQLQLRSSGPTPPRTATSTAPCAASPAARSTSSPGASARPATWDDIVLSPDRMQLLRELVARYRHADEVYDAWGFSAAPSRGQVALFSGPSGTGKTLAAEIIAGELGLDLFKLDLSAVVSKYIGETEKNLDQIFDAARAGNVVLFFDEADSLFGKRSEVKDARTATPTSRCPTCCSGSRPTTGWSRWRRTSSATSTTRSCAGSTSASSSRSPDEAERKAIWEHNLPAPAPDRRRRRPRLPGPPVRAHRRLDPQRRPAGRVPRRAGDGIIDMDCLVRGVGREYQKLGRLLKAEDFGPYTDAIAR